jgi:hypothetical protein
VTFPKLALAIFVPARDCFPCRRRQVNFENVVERGTRFEGGRPTLHWLQNPSRETHGEPRLRARRKDNGSWVV